MALRRPRPLCSLLVLVALLLTGTASYTVQPGDTLSEIAERLGVSVAALASANGIANPDHVVDGTRLTMPGPAGGSGGSHLVVFGETLSGIAARYGVGAAALAAENGMGVGDLLLAGRRLRIPSAGAPAVVRAGGRAEVGALLEETAARYGLDPAMVKAIAWQESGWQQHVVSPDKAIGIMQVLPSTGRFVGESLVGRSLDLGNPVDNVEAGVAFLSYLGRLTGGDDRASLAGYYQGLRSVRVNGLYTDTTRYVDNVLALRARFS